MPGMGRPRDPRRAAQAQAPPPVVYVTGSDESSVAVAALKAGAADYVVKTLGDDSSTCSTRLHAGARAGRGCERRKPSAEEALQASNERLADPASRGQPPRRQQPAAGLLLGAHAGQRRSTTSRAREALEDTQRRIEAIMQVHRRLYTSDDVETVEWRTISRPWSPSCRRPGRLRHAPRTILPDRRADTAQTDKAVSLGVIVNELVTNACKYAYGPKEARRGARRLHSSRARAFRLAVEDDGPGRMDPEPQPKALALAPGSLSAMAKALSRQSNTTAIMPACGLSFPPLIKSCSRRGSACRVPSASHIKALHHHVADDRQRRREQDADAPEQTVECKQREHEDHRRQFDRDIAG